MNLINMVDLANAYLNPDRRRLPADTSEMTYRFPR